LLSFVTSENYNFIEIHLLLNKKHFLKRIFRQSRSAKDRLSMQQTLGSIMARLFSMSDETWEKHANPWSVWTRFTALPVLTASIWSRVWIGPWAWGLIVLAIFWIWVNPRIFSKPVSADNWASKAVLGERVWINRKQIPVPKHHRLVPNLLSGISGLGLLFLIWGLWRLDIWPTVLGAILIYAGKVWFLDRMAWLYEDMKDSTKEYSRWLYNNNIEQGAEGDPVNRAP
jgi:hypothetical protein